MARKSVRQQEALRRARERQRAKDAAATLPPAEVRLRAGAPVGTVSETVSRRLAAASCGWCDGPIEHKTRGRIPKWCSAACRQRAWEQSRAAASGRSAIQVVERRVEIPVEKPTPPPARPRHTEWVDVLTELAGQLDTGDIYDRDLPALTGALNQVLDAFSRRPYVQRQTTRS